MTASVSTRVRKVVSQIFGITASQISEATGAETLEAWDSIHHLQLLVSLEEEFAVSFDPDQAIELTSVGAIEAALTAMGIAA